MRVGNTCLGTASECSLASSYFPAPTRTRTIRVLLSKDAYAFGELAGQPRDWEGMNETMMKIFEIIAQAYTFKPGDLESRRGRFPSVACGISYGGGQKVSLGVPMHCRALSLEHSVPATSRTARTIAPCGRLSWT